MMIVIANIHRAGCVQTSDTKLVCLSPGSMFGLVLGTHHLEVGRLA